MSLEKSFHANEKILEICLDLNETNALERKSFEEFYTILLEQKQNLSLKVVVLTSKNPNFFSNGFDPKEFVGKSFAEIKSFLEVVHAFALEYHFFPIPTIVSINGHCMGMGSALAIDSDYRFMNSKKGRIGFPESLISLNFPAIMGENLRLLVGKKATRDILYFGKSFKAEEAKEIGLVDFAVPPETLREETFSFAEELSKHTRIALSGMKRCLSLFGETRMKELVEQDILDLSHAVASPAGQEGLRSVLERRRPNFEKFTT